MPPKQSVSRVKRTKAENQKELDKIREEVYQHKAESNPKQDETLRIREVEIREAVQDLTVDSIIQKVSNLGSDVSKGLSELSARLVTGTSMLQSLREAVQIEKKELERLHKIDVVATALDELMEEYKTRKAELEAEVKNAEQSWTEQLRIRERDQKEYDENLNRLRTREREDYEYQKALERKKEQDKYQESIRAIERKNLERQEMLEKSWKMRETQLTDRENEYAQLKKESAQFPEQLKREVETARANSIEATELRYTQEKLISQKDFESERKILQMKIDGLTDVVERQSNQIELLQRRLEEAKNQVQDIAIKAIEGASGARALSHINQIAMEQAKTRTGQV